jgi:hypothetical protein
MDPSTDAPEQQSQLAVDHCDRAVVCRFDQTADVSQQGLWRDQ